MSVLASQTVVNALDGPTRCTLESLLEEYGYSPTSLEGLSHIETVLDHYKIILDPPIGAYSIDKPRILKPQRSPSKIRETIDTLIEKGGENYGVELKASVRIDTRKRQYNPGLDIQEYVSDTLSAKAAQEIAAFLNRDGGIILFGISNDLEIMGCEDDFESFIEDGTPQDKADLMIKQIVEKHFYDPKSSLSHIQIDCEKYNGKFVVMLSIAANEKLAFLKVSDKIKHSLFKRIGTSADPIPYHEIEAHFNVRKMA